MPPLVTFLSDFGLADTYTAQVKAAVLSRCPPATVVDLTHQVPAQNIRAGAFLLWSAVEAFPPGTIHLAVVDPGVGSSRRGVAVRSKGGHFFVGPDNGLLVPALERTGGAEASLELDRNEFWRANVCPTFHGRDVFGPVAGHLASGVPLESLGGPIPELSQPFVLPLPRSEDGVVHGDVLHIDTYGNVITNVTPDLLPRRFRVKLNGSEVCPGPSHHFEEVARGQIAALVGSLGLLELFLRDGSAATTLRAHVGDRVQIDRLH